MLKQPCMSRFAGRPATKIVTGAAALGLMLGGASVAHAELDQPFTDGFESYATGDIKPSGMPIGHPDRENPDTPWAGAAAHFGKIVNIDDEGIRDNTPSSQFGEQVLRFDNPHDAGSAPSQTIDQASRAFHSDVVGLDYDEPIEVHFDIRSIEGASGTVSAEVNLGRARAGRLFFRNTEGAGLRVTLTGGEGFQNAGGGLTVEFVSDALTMGEWHRIGYGLDVANDRYTFIEINGDRFDNDGEGWNAGVNRFGDDIQHVHLIQDSNAADEGGIYLDNVDVFNSPVPEEREVAIEVQPRPGQGNPPVNIQRRGELPVAIFSESDFDARDVVVGSVLFGDPAAFDNGGEPVSPVSSAVEDVDGDGLDDLVLFFDIEEIADAGALTSDSTEAALEGITADGLTIVVGVDDVRVTPAARGR